MKKHLFAVIALACLLSTPAAATRNEGVVFAQAAAPPAATVTTTTPTTPTTVTTVVKGGTVAAQVIEWVQVAFGTTLGAAALWAFVKGLSWMGIKITDDQKGQLQSIIVNGLNSAAAKAAVDLRSTDKLDIRVKSKIVADAVDYTQRHAGETIKALGLDPKSGEAVEAIKARIETALNDPATPTPPAITPDVGKPVVLAEAARV